MGGSLGGGGAIGSPRGPTYELFGRRAFGAPPSAASAPSKEGLPQVPRDRGIINAPSTAPLVAATAPPPPPSDRGGGG